MEFKWSKDKVNRVINEVCKLTATFVKKQKKKFALVSIFKKIINIWKNEATQGDEKLSPWNVRW